MRRSGLFWGSILILIGALLLLQTLGILTIDVWKVFWPVVLIGLGVWTLWGVMAGGRSAKPEQVSIPLAGVGRARVRVRHGAGRLEVNAGAGASELVAGTFNGGLDYRSRQDGDTLDVKMRVPDPGFPMPWMWGPGRGFDWAFSLNGGVPLALDFETGASDMRLDLTDLRVTDLRLQTGASSTDLKLPANAGYTRVNFEGGAASLKIRVPTGVGARLRIRSGVSGISVDQGRFPRLGDVYQSMDYDTAPNKVEIEAQMGAGSIDVR